MEVGRIEAVKISKKQAVKYAATAAYDYCGKEIKKVKYLGGGSFGRAVLVSFKGGAKIVIKLLRAKNMLEKEVHDCALLAQKCPVKMPSVLFSRKRDAKIPLDLYAMEYIEGNTALMSLGMLLISRRRREKFADEVTTALHELHKNTAEKFGDSMHPDCDGWLDYYRPFARAVLDEAERVHSQGKLSAHIIGAMRVAWSKFDIIFSEKVETACLIHGDLNVGNIMVGKGYKLTGFIDPLNCMYADREYDLFQFDNLTGKHFFLRETYTKKYGASRYCKQKLAFYGLWNEVYCYIKSGVLVNIIMNPLVKNMLKAVQEL